MGDRYNCGIFNVNSTLTMTIESPLHCVVLLLLTIGGTGIPLLIIILMLLCIVCCTCRILMRRPSSFDISEAEKGKTIKGSEPVSSVQLKEIDLPKDPQDEVIDALYDSVDEINRFQCRLNTATAEITKAKQTSKEESPQPYLEYRQSVAIEDQPLYAKPDKSKKIPKPEADDKQQGNRRSMPLIEQYSSLERIDKRSGSKNRHSVNNIPDGLYSNLEVPPLPPPLAPQDLPLDADGTIEVEVEIEVAGNGTEAKDEVEDSPLYCNVSEARTGNSMNEKPKSTTAEKAIKKSVQVIEPPRERIGTIEANPEMEEAAAYYNVSATVGPKIETIENGTTTSEQATKTLDEEFEALQDMLQFSNV